MPLESLSNEQFNIHDLTLEQEKKPQLEWRTHYKELKETNFDSLTNRWKETERGGLWDTTDQLCSVLIEYQINPEEAASHYDQLLKSSFHNQEARNWKIYPDMPDSHHSEDELIGVLIESLFDKEKAYNKFLDLKKSPFFSKRFEKWLPVKGESSSYFGTTEQLLEVLVEYQFDQKEAKKLFDDLKKDPLLFDNKKNQWESLRIINASTINHSERLTRDQMLAIIIESKFDKSLAQRHFKDLKNTQLYDKSTDRWYFSISQDQNLSNHALITTNQLFAVLCEQAIEEPKNLEPNTPPLPESRKY